MQFNPYFADVSAYQPHVNMHDYADAGHLLIAIKATEGRGYINPYHRGQSYAAGSVHVGVVHYHFGRPDLGSDPALEAVHFLNVALPLAGPYDYLVLDLERATPQGWTYDPSWSRQFDNYVREHSRFSVILYASRSELVRSDKFLSVDPKRVWDAAYSTEPDYAPPGYTVAFRQFTDGLAGPEPHSFAGIGACDGSRMSRQIFNHMREYR